MVNYIPSMDDEISYYAFLPTLATLYGRDNYPRRWIRVVDDGIGDFTTNQFTEGDGRIPSDVIETIEVKTFMLGITYGHTPYIETAFSGFESGIDLSAYRDAIFNQAMMRNYDHRAKTLLAMCKDKRSSFASRSTSNPATEELVSELYGVLVLWESLMNNGTIMPKSCLHKAYNEFGDIRDGMHISATEERFQELRGRMLASNHKNLQYKMAAEQRNTLLRSYGLN